MNTTTQDTVPSAFLPVCLVALSSVILLTWNLIIVVNQHSAAVRISSQQEVQLAQAIQAETKLKQMMSDLVELSKTDTDAETIVKRYGIAFTPPAGTAGSVSAPMPKALEKKAPAKAAVAP